MGHEGRAALLGRVEGREQLGGFEQLVPVVNAGYAVLFEGGVINLVRAGEGGGVGLGGARPQRGAPYLHRRNRLAALGGEFRHFQKLARVPKALYEHGYGFRVVVIQQIAREVGRVEVGFVAGGYDVRVADSPLGGAREEWPERRRSALAHEPDAAAFELDAVEARG